LLTTPLHYFRAKSELRDIERTTLALAFITIAAENIRTAKFSNPLRRIPVFRLELLRVVVLL
jgi:hypothetical protein